jgi:hypothetical protein
MEAGSLELWNKAYEAIDALTLSLLSKDGTKIGGTRPSLGWC